MAFDLKAVLRLDDKFSNPLRKIQRQVERNERALKSMRTATDKATQSTGRLSSGISNIGKASSGLGSVSTAFVGIAAAIGGATAAAKIFDKTIGEAAKFEQSQVVIGAMMNNDKLAKDYMKLIDSFAIDSPVMDSQAMYANSKSFITQSKDMGQLEKMWSLTERMAAIDPTQGVDGAVFALRELFSGDAVSMVERFEMSRTEMNRIKKLELPEQLKELDKYFNKIGMTQRLIDDMGGTTLGIWAQIKESVAVVLRDMGAPALTSIKKFLNGVLGGLSSVKEVAKMRNFMEPGEYQQAMERAMRIEDFKETGGKILKSVADGFIAASTGIGKYIDQIRNNPDFLKETTLFGQVKWIMTDIYAKFQEWLKNGGSAKIEKIAADVIQVLLGAIEASIENILPIAIQIGGALGKGIIQGFQQSMGESWLARLIKDPVGFVVNGTANKITGRDDWNAFGDYRPKKKGESKASGLSRVPYNGYQATLHKNERVLTPEEAKSYNNGGKTVNVSFAGANFNVRQDSDIKKIAYELAKLIESEGVKMA